MYSQIESAVRAPSLGVIGNLAAALEVSIGDLFGDSAPAFDPIHTRAGQGRPVTLPDYPESAFHWVGGAELGQMRVSAVLCSSLGRSTGELSLQFDGLWIDHVLAGDAVVEVGGRSYHLKAGDTLTYRAEVPMRMVRCSDDLRVVALSARLL